MTCPLGPVDGPPCLQSPQMDAAKKQSPGSQIPQPGNSKSSTNPLSPEGSTALHMFESCPADASPGCIFISKLRSRLQDVLTNASEYLLRPECPKVHSQLCFIQARQGFSPEHFTLRLRHVSHLRCCYQCQVRKPSSIHTHSWIGDLSLPWRI